MSQLEQAAKEGGGQRSWRLMEFYASWCPYSLVARKVSRSAADHIDCELTSIDVDEQPEVTSQHGIVSVPTILLLHDGQCVLRWHGQTNPEDVVIYLAEFVGNFSG